MAAMLSASSRRLQSLQFRAAYRDERAQRINRIAVYKFSQFRKRLVRREIRIDDCPNDYLGPFRPRPSATKHAFSLNGRHGLRIAHDERKRPLPPSDMFDADHRAAE